MTERIPMQPATTLSKPPPRRSAAPAETPAPPLPPAKVDAPVQSSAPAKAERKTARAADTGGLRSTSISLPAHLSEWVGATAKARGLTAAQVMLEAVEAVADRLDELVRAEQGHQRSTSSIFPEAASVTRRTSEQRVTRDLTTPKANLVVLDELAAKAGAASRSQLITAALRAAQ